MCCQKIAELRKEILRRGDIHALAVLDGNEDLVKEKKAWSDTINFAELSVCELLEFHSKSKCWYDMRRRNKCYPKLSMASCQ